MANARQLGKRAGARRVPPAALSPRRSYRRDETIIPFSFLAEAAGRTKPMPPIGLMHASRFLMRHILEHSALRCPRFLQPGLEVGHGHLRFLSRGEAR